MSHLASHEGTSALHFLQAYRREMTLLLRKTSFGTEVRQTDTSGDRVLYATLSYRVIFVPSSYHQTSHSKARRLFSREVFPNGIQ